MHFFRPPVRLLPYLREVVVILMAKIVRCGQAAAGCLQVKWRGQRNRWHRMRTHQPSLLSPNPLSTSFLCPSPTHPPFATASISLARLPLAHASTCPSLPWALEPPHLAHLAERNLGRLQPIMKIFVAAHYLLPGANGRRFNSQEMEVDHTTTVSLGSPRSRTRPRPSSLDRPLLGKPPSPLSSSFCLRSGRE